MKRVVLMAITCLLICSAPVFSQTTVIDSIFSNGIYRSYRLYLPKKFDSGKPCPLVFNLHGYMSNAVQQQQYANFMAIADTAGFLTVYPQGTSYQGNPYWNAAMDPAGANDVLFISDLIDHLASRYKIDMESIYSCGMSMGGFMSYTLACTLGHRIAAIASVTGTFFRSYYTGCSPARAVPTMEIHGTNDLIVPYNGNGTMIGIDTVVNYWVKNNDCQTPAIFKKVPDINVFDGSTAEHYVYEAKKTGGATCELYKVVGGGHTWPGSSFLIPFAVTNQDFNAADKIWLFFRKYKSNINTGITGKNNRPAATTIYPNPCMDKIKVTGNDIQRITIVDIAGSEVMETTETALDISRLAKGIFAVVVTYKNNLREVKKLVKL